ncbi:FkbM family methyltransferase [Pleurocapsales cyanobacterium LEGE 10410]|nr:FkbM family methyltransferase [Pleurocapsales cyanobacterium LEGE 10410]
MKLQIKERIFTQLAQRAKVDSLLTHSSMKIGGRNYLIPQFLGFRCRELRQPNFNLQREQYLDRCLKAILNFKSGAFLDVGANMGQTLLKILSIDASRQYFGFEPNIECCFYLEQLIALNQIQNCIVLPVGLSNRTGVERLFTRQDKSVTASLVKDFRPDSFYSSSKYVDVAVGDSVLEKLDLAGIAVLKLDVEGGELECIEGLEQSICKYRPFIIFEVLQHYLAVGNTNLDESVIQFRERRLRKLEEHLDKHAYSKFQIEPDGKLVNVTKIQPGTNPDLSRINYLAVPHEEEKGFFRFLDKSLS